MAVFGPPSEQTGAAFDPTRLREAIAAYERERSIATASRKWQELLGSGVPVEHAQPLMALDARRIQAGNRPYSRPQSMLMAAQVGSREQILPAPNQGFLSRARTDLGHLVRGVFDLPKMLWREAKAIPTIPGELADAAADAGANPLRLLGNVAGDVPVARMLPGAFIAENVGKGTPGELWEHPLFTLLDVVDAGSVATRAATGRPVRHHVARGVRSGAAAVQRARPHWRIGTPEHPLGQVLARGALGRRGGVGPFARAASVEVSGANQLLRSALERRHKKLKRLAAPISPERRADLYRLLTTGSLDAAADTATRAKWRDLLTPDEDAFVRFLEKQNDQIAKAWVRDGEGFVWNGEFYGANDATKGLRSAVAEVERITARLVEVKSRVGPGTADKVKSLNTALTAARNTANELAYSMPSARFQPFIEESTLQAVRNLATSRGASPADVASLLDHVQMNTLREMERIASPTNPDVPLLSKDEFIRLRNDIAQTWTKAKRDGFSPVFVHRISQGQSRELIAPHIIAEGGPKPSAQGNRMLTGGESFVSDLVLSASHQFLEYLQPQFQGYAFEQFKKAGLAKPAQQVREDMAARAADAAQKLRAKGKEPDVKRIRESLMAEWVSYDPTRVVQRRPSLEGFADEYLVPKAVADALDAAAAAPGFFMGAARKPMNLFRMSVLTLSPNYYIANMIGDSILNVARTDLTALAYYPKALRAMREGNLDPALPRGLAEMPTEAKRWAAEDGRRIAEWYWQRTGKDIGTVWKLAEWINDATRLTAYLHQLDKAQKGKAKWQTGERAGTRVSQTKAEARKFALEQQNRIFQNWATMTPVERTAIRGLFPFYGWSRFVLRYTFSYPFDHPVRASVLLNMTSSELADQPEVERLRNTIMMGSGDNQWGVPMGTINPFADVANVFTLGGFMSKFNPFISASLESLGVDPFTATPQQFGLESQFDPRTGRLVSAPRGIAHKFISNLMPQAGGVIDLLNPSEDTKRLQRINPSAWSRHILGSFGLRAIPTRYSMPEERAREAVARLDALRKSLGETAPSGLTYPADAAPLLHMLARDRVSG